MAEAAGDAAGERDGTGPVPELDDRAARAADRVRGSESVLLASHVDADGLTSAAVASRALERADVPHDVVFFEQLDEEAVERVARADHDTVLFTDFGSGQLDTVAVREAAGAFDAVVCDHHQPASAADCDAEHVTECEGYADVPCHVNPLLVGVNGASELSGAGAAYVLARALEGEGDNRDLAALAVVGAVGDMQDQDGKLVGANAAIAAEGVAAGVLDTSPDLALYGRQTRPLPKLLEYASDVHVPGVTGDRAGARGFLADLDVDLRDGDGWRTWADLDAGERQTVASALMQRAVARGVPARKVEALVGTAYTLTGEAAGTELRDASEFSTLLNATARYERSDVGLAVCLGDRGDALAEARRLLREHRRNLSEGVDWVEAHGVTSEKHCQWFHAGGRIRDTIVGIVAGMAMGAPGIDRDRPIVAFADKTDEEVKVSARGTHALVRRGLDLSAVMREAAREVGGDGGGHDVAAGATVPRGEEEAFVAAVDRLVGNQLD